MGEFGCGHPPSMELSLDTVSNEKLIIPICDNCYDNNKEDIQKHKLGVKKIQ